MALDPSDEITRDTLVAKGGDVVNSRVRQALGLPELVTRLRLLWVFSFRTVESNRPCVEMRLSAPGRSRK